MNTSSGFGRQQAGGALALSVPTGNASHDNSVVNVWLMVLLILGSIIVFADGTTRDALPGDEPPLAPVMARITRLPRPECAMPSPFITVHHRFSFSLFLS